MYLIRTILDSKEDVIRTISINEHCSLEQLHFGIINAFGFKGQELASFFKTDDQWNQGQEIPLFTFDESDKDFSMSTCILKDVLKTPGDKLIYIYDFLKMWSFYIELVSYSDKLITEPKIVLAVGELPTKAPERNFKTDDKYSLDEFESNNFNTSFENIDDIDSYIF